jgi:peptide deformylase
MSIKPIVSNIKELRKPCEIVKSDEDVSAIIQDLKDTLIANGHGYALAAPQIGVTKQIFYLRIPKAYNPQTKETTYTEAVVINPKIIERDRKIVFKNEGCLSFPGLRVTTDRYVYCTVQFEDENRKGQVGGVQDIESFVWQHEVDHLNGLVLMDRKHKAR